jgi:hypothetical protein
VASKRTPPVSATTAAPADGTKKLSYDAVADKGRRRAPSTVIAAEHVILPDSKRKKMLATVQDQVRNASTAAWMVRKHLDYVSRFRFQFRTGKSELDKLVNRILDWHGKPKNFDISGRLGREEMFRLFEAEKVTAGDAGIVKINDFGLKCQAVESDLITIPKVGKMTTGKKGQYDTIPKEIYDLVDKETGIVLSTQFPGLVDKWCICNRGWDGKSVSFDRLEDAKNIIFGAYYTRFGSQWRGVSPLSTAINAIQDLYEGFEWNLLKAKIHAIFGVAVMRDYAAGSSDQEEVSGLGSASGITTGTDEGLLSASQTAEGTKSISSSLQQLTPDSMLMVDMETKGRIDTIESRTPSSEFQTFSELILRIALLALDIPYTSLNPTSASFAAMIADQNIYEVACRWKRDKNRWARHEYSDWLLTQIWNDTDTETNWGLKAVANSVGITRIRDILEECEWISMGQPWLQKLNEVAGDTASISAMIDNPIDICQRRGTDVFENIDKMKQVMDYAKENGVPIMFGSSGQATIAEAVLKSEIQGGGNNDSTSK